MVKFSRSLPTLFLAATMLATCSCEIHHRKQFHSRLQDLPTSARVHEVQRKGGNVLAAGSRLFKQYSTDTNHLQPPQVTDRATEAYMKSIPLRLLDCLEHVSLVDCGKLYLVQNMESKDYRFANTGNLTHDIQQVLLPGYRDADNKLFSDQLLALNASDVNDRLARGLRLLLHERIVDLALLPGVAVRLTPSESNQLEFSVRKNVAVLDEAVGRGKAKKGIRTVLQLSVPLILLPSMLLAGVMPMILPVLKFATVFSSIVNHAALAAAIMYLAKQHAAEQESKQTVYFNAGYN